MPADDLPTLAEWITGPGAARFAVLAYTVAALGSVGDGGIVALTSRLPAALYDQLDSAESAWLSDPPRR